MCDYLLNGYLDHILFLCDIETIWSHFKLAISSAMLHFIPQITLRSHQRPAWFSSELVHKLNKVHTVRKVCRSNPTPQRLAKLETMESDLQQSMHEAKSTHEMALVSNYAYSNNSKIFKYIKSITSSNELPTLMHLETSSADNDSDKAFLFNKFFHSVFTVSHFNLPEVDHLPTPSSTLSEFTFTQAEVYDALSELNPNKSVGVHNFSPKIYKYCTAALYIPIHHLFSLCILQHNIPFEWRIHRFTPVFKSGAKTQVKNYRPISLLCIISKVL